MFDILIESRAHTALGLPRWGVAFAFGMHAVVIGAILRAPAPPVEPPIWVETGIPAFNAPPNPHEERLAAPAPPVVDVRLPALPEPQPLPGVPGLAVPTPVRPDGPVGVPVDPGEVGGAEPLPASLVQELPELLAVPLPVYPTHLREAGVEGLVLVQLVVDTAGLVEPGSVRVVQSAHGGFDAAAVRAILAARFRPARVWGRAVRVLVQVPVAFRLRPLR